MPGMTGCLLVSAREAVGYWQEEEMRSPPVMKPFGLCAGLLYIHDC